ncbi:hypothetical protein ACFWIV_18925 [Streptomyces virginiae]|uniref:hypothetical protein n=1 Tax=Streptomyces virginiae TaxID=1961 RepID=UPI0036484A2B
MSGADEGVAAWLSGFAEAAAVVLATPSECREAMRGALDRCWEELRQVARHRPPYANDAADLFDRFESARTSLERALWAAAAPDRSGADPAGEADPPGPDLTDPDLCAIGTGDTAAVDREPERTAGSVVPAPADAGAAGRATTGETPDGPDAAGTVESVPGAQPSPPDPADEEPPAPDPLAGFADALDGLESELLAEQIRYLPRTPQAAAADPPATAADRVAATWQRVHMALLRLPATLREEWRARTCETASAAGLAVTAEDSTDPDVIVPGLPQGLYTAERVRLAIAVPRVAAINVPAEIHRSLATSPGTVMKLPPTDPRLAWAVRAEQALRLVELDPELHVAVLVEDHPSSLASQDARLRYRQHLHRLLEAAGSSQATKWSAESRLGAAHELDMVLGGLVHKRPAALDSWWWQWRNSVSEILRPLAESARYELVPKPVAKWDRHDVDAYTVKHSVSGQSGEPTLVQWVLWTPLKPKGASTRPNDRKGRIVMRPETLYGRTAP